MQFSNVSTAVFPAHAKRCLKQDGANYLKKENAIWRLRHKEMRNQLLQASLRGLIPHFL
jgi:hypothetical protein